MVSGVWRGVNQQGRNVLERYATSMDYRLGVVSYIDNRTGNSCFTAMPEQIQRILQVAKPNGDFVLPSEETDEPTCGSVETLTYFSPNYNDSDENYRLDVSFDEFLKLCNPHVIRKSVKYEAVRPRQKFSMACA